MRLTPADWCSGDHSISKSTVSLLLGLVLPMHLKKHWDKILQCLRYRA
jgi:hypothetical protein